MMWFDMDTFVLAIATMVMFIILWGWHTDHLTKFDMKEVLTDSQTGKVSLRKIGQFTALLVTTWVLIHETRDKRLTEWLYLSYGTMWVAANLGSKWISGKQTSLSEKRSSDGA